MCTVPPESHFKPRAASTALASVTAGNAAAGARASIAIGAASGPGAAAVREPSYSAVAAYSTGPTHHSNQSFGSSRPAGVSMTTTHGGGAGGGFYGGGSVLQREDSVSVTGLAPVVVVVNDRKVVFLEPNEMEELAQRKQIERYGRPAPAIELSHTHPAAGGSGGGGGGAGSASAPLLPSNSVTAVSGGGSPTGGALYADLTYRPTAAPTPAAPVVTAPLGVPSMPAGGLLISPRASIIAALAVTPPPAPASASGAPAFAPPAPAPVLMSPAPAGASPSQQPPLPTAAPPMPTLPPAFNS